VDGLSAARARQWLERGWFVRDRSPAFHVLEAGAPPVRLVAGALAPGSSELPLERRDGPAASPLELVPALAADDEGVLRGLCAEAVANRAPELELSFPEGPVRSWPVRSPALHARLARALDDVTVRPLSPLQQGAGDTAVLLGIVPLSEPSLRLRPIHRGLRGLEVFHEDRFLTVVSGYARIYELEGRLTTAAGLQDAAERMAALARGNHVVLLVLPGGRGKILRVRQGLELEHIPAVPRNPTLRSLDLALLNALVFRTVLGLRGVEQTDHPNLVPVASLEGLVRSVSSGELQAGFALNPPPAWEIRAVMEAGQQLPPLTVAVEPLPPAHALLLDPDAERGG
jgi:hypothetical protein